MNEDLTGEANNIANEQGKINAATSIITAISEWDTRKLSAERRFIFELIQNSLDTATARHADDFKIKIKVSDDKFIFSHNAGFFEMAEIVALIFGGSSKPFDVESNFLGRFGTGFLVTHVISKELSINSVLKTRKGDFYAFNLRIDRRSSNKGEILKSIDNSFSQLNEARKIKDYGEFWTKFSYDIGPDKRIIAEKGIELLKTNMSAILGFNRKISEIIINDDVYHPKFSTGIIDILCSIPKLDQILRIYPKKDEKLQIGLIFEEGKYSNKRRPPIFIGMPLSDTQDFLELPFLINSLDFSPTKERDALSNDEGNKSLLSNSFKMFEEYIASIISELRDVEFFSNVFTFGKIPEEKMKDNEIWQFLDKIERTTFEKIYNEIGVVKVNDSYLSIKDTILPNKMVSNKPMDFPQFKSFVTLLSHTNKKIPIGLEQEHWLEMAEKMAPLFPKLVKIYTLENLKNDLKFKENNAFPTISRIEEVMGWNAPDSLLLNFFNIADNLYGKKIIQRDFVEDLIPDQNNSLGQLKGTFQETNIQWELSLEPSDKPIPEELKDILKKIGRDVRSDLVHKKYSNFAIINDFVSKVSEIESILNSLLSKHYELPNKIENFAGDRINGWTELFVWCVKNNALFKNFPLITKDGSVKQLEEIEKLSFLLPFDVLKIDKEFEKLFPDSRIINQYYFRNIGDLEQLLLKLEQIPAFGVRLIDTYKSIQISSNRLRSISANSEDKIVTSSHRISADKKVISAVPFINEVIGKIGESREQARMFLRFCVEILSKADKTFNDRITVSCDCGKDRKHDIYPSEWLASLKSDQWVPYVVKQLGEDATNKINKYSPTRECIENLYSENLSELNSLMSANSEVVELLFPHLGYDKLDLAIKLKSLSSLENEKTIRDRTSKIFNVFKEDDVFKLVSIEEDRPGAISEMIDQIRKKINDDQRRETNKIIGKNIEKIIRKILEENEFKVKPIYKGGDLEAWPKENEGFDAGSIEAGKITIEVKFTVGLRVHLSKLQSQKSTQNINSYVVLVIHDQNNSLRNRLIEPLDVSSIPRDILLDALQQSHIIERIGGLLTHFQDSEEVEADLNGYWIKKKAWEQKASIQEWSRKTYST